MGNWYSEFEKGITQKLKGTKDRDLRFFRIEEFMRIAERVDNFSSTCRECKSFKFEIDKQKDSLSKALKSPGRERREYDKLHSGMSKHMQKVHGFYPPFYFTYLYAAIWSVLLISFSLLFWLFFSSITIWAFLTPAFAIGVITGQIIGGKKDRKIRLGNKLL